ncbi:MAG: acyl dehydratase [Alphaproteobacteria bacterium HGW-Alphaproteobacteria-3]|nr:MAG: acyl dehydratase [Alphaproteobacteria bacterium HGW-Alphaproteobacteria-3]
MARLDRAIHVLLSSFGPLGLCAGRNGRTRMRHFDDFVLGERHDIPARYEMTKDEIVSFATKWDPQPFHIDDAAAAKSVYGTLTACGTHIQAVVLWLASRLPEETAVIGALGYDEVRFLKAAKLGDTLRLVIECIETKPSASKPDRGVVKNRHILMNQNGETIFTQTTTLLIARKT